MHSAPRCSSPRAEARLKAIEGRRLIFDVVVYDNLEKIAEGENEQIIVSKDSFLQKVTGKRIDISGHTQPSGREPR